MLHHDISIQLTSNIHQYDLYSFTTMSIKITTNTVDYTHTTYMHVFNIYSHQCKTDSSHLQPCTWDTINQTQLPTTIKDHQQRDHRNQNTTPEDKVNNPTKHDYLSLSKIANNPIASHLTYLQGPHQQPDGLHITPHFQQML
jgi:hypothetical protein